MKSEIDNGHLDIRKQIQSDSLKHAKILDSALKVRILMMLLIFPELSLTQLSKKMNKSKSTISTHMNQLMDLDFVTMREKHHRGSIKQKLYCAAKKHGYRGRNYHDMKQDSPDDFLKHLQEEYLINLRLFTYIQETTQQISQFIDDFYTNLTANDLNDEFKDEIYRYNTCVPRITFMTKEEYIDYREKFIDFDDKYIEKMELERVKNPNDEPKEYLVVHELVPIQRVLNYVLNKNKKKN